jgi:hypothetical protein
MNDFPSQTLISQIPDLHTARFAAGMGATICSFRATDFALSDLKEICGWLQGVEIWIENPPLEQIGNYDFVSGFIFDSDFYIKNKSEIEVSGIEKSLILRLSLSDLVQFEGFAAKFPKLIVACERGEKWEMVNIENLKQKGFEKLELLFIEGAPDFYEPLSPQDLAGRQVAISVAFLTDFEPLYDWFEKYEA